MFNLFSRSHLLSLSHTIPSEERVPLIIETSSKIYMLDMMSRAGNLEICKARFSTLGHQCSGTVAAAEKAVSVMDAQFLAEVI